MLDRKQWRPIDPQCSSYPIKCKFYAAGHRILCLKSSLSMLILNVFWTRFFSRFGGVGGLLPMKAPVLNAWSYPAFCLPIESRQLFDTGFGDKYGGKNYKIRVTCWPLMESELMIDLTHWWSRFVLQKSFWISLILTSSWSSSDDVTLMFWWLNTSWRLNNKQIALNTFRKILSDDISYWRVYPWFTYTL